MKKIYKEYSDLHEDVIAFFCEWSSLWRKIRYKLLNSNIKVPKNFTLWARLEATSKNEEWFIVKKIANGYVYSDEDKYKIDSFDSICLIDLFKDLMDEIMERELCKK